MRCPDQGILLLYMDKALTKQEMRESELHIKTCSECARLLQELQSDLEYARRVIVPLQERAELVPVPGAEQVWDRVKKQVMAGKRGNKHMKVKKWAIACTLVLALGTVLAVPSLRVAAGNLLQVFRVDKVESISLSQEDINQISEALKNGDPNIDLKNYGRIECIGKHSNSELSQEQVKKLPFTLKLPEGALNGQNKLYLEKSPEMQITPRVDKINQLLTNLGSSELLPANLDGKTFTVKTNDMVTLKGPGYILTQGPTPTVNAPDGVDVNRLVQAMLAIPIWPENVKQQMKAIEDWQHTLIVPGEGNKKVDINGVQGVLTGADGRTGLVWQDQGILYLLFSQPGSSTDLLQVARSMR